jgi:PAS domain S-box-containing protein
MLSDLFNKKESHEDFLFNASPEIIVYLDLRGRITKINRRVFEWLGYKQADLVGKNVFDLAFLTPESISLIKHNFARRLRGEEIKPYDIKCIAKNGNIEAGRITARLIKKAKIPVGVLAMISNVTQLEVQLKANLNEIREKEVRYQGLYDHINLAAVICDFDEDKQSYKIKEVNKFLRRLEKVNKKDIVGKKLKKLFPGVSPEELYQVLTKAWNDDSNSAIKFNFDINKDGVTQIKQGEVYRLPTDELVVLYSDVTKQVQLSQNLADSEEKFRTIFENSTDAIFLMDVKKFIDCNKVTLNIYGCEKRSDIIGLSPVDFSPKMQPDGQSSQRKALRLIRAAVNKKPQRFYWQHTKKNGDLFDAEVSLKRVEVGDKVLILATVKDITERLAIKKKLEASEEKLRAFFDNNRDALFVAEVKSRKLVDVNDKAIKLSGYSQKELLSMKADELHPPQIVKKTINDGFVRQAKGEIEQFETILLTKKHQEIPVSVTTSIYRADDGKEYLQGSFRDISKRKKALDDLAESESIFRSIVQNSQAIVFLIDKNGKFTLSEGKKLHVLGLKPGEAVGQDVFEMYQDYPNVGKGVREALRGKVNKAVNKIGDAYFDVFFSPHRDVQGNIQGVFGMAIDVTESRLSMSKLIELDEKKNEFISMASHQLRTPLGNTRWGLEAILNSGEYQSDEKLMSKLRNIYITNIRLIKLVGNLLNISRIESNRVLDNPVKLDLIKLIHDIITEQQEKIERNNLTVTLNMPNSLTVYYDKKLIREVISNIVSNAIKFNKKDGVVLIEVIRNDQTISFSIANTGQTILKSDQSDIFERFHRGSNIAERIPGSGLGLYITREYIRKWDGTITFESPTEFGERTINGTKYSGTVFTVNLPVSLHKVK